MCGHSRSHQGEGGQCCCCLRRVREVRGGGEGGGDISAAWMQTLTLTAKQEVCVTKQETSSFKPSAARQTVTFSLQIGCDTELNGLPTWTEHHQWVIHYFEAELVTPF